MPTAIHKVDDWRKPSRRPISPLAGEMPTGRGGARRSAMLAQIAAPFSSPQTKLVDEVARRSRDGEGAVVRYDVQKFGCDFAVHWGSNLKLVSGRNAPSSSRLRRATSPPPSVGAKKEPALAIKQTYPHPKFLTYNSASLNEGTKWTGR
jgi:hypothetical protein